MAEFDLAIIGGGINGVGIARDAAGRGLKVLLVEQNDLAAGTSSASTKLIHGGLRYLAQGALRLVRESLAEREVLMRIAPHLVAHAGVDQLGHGPRHGGFRARRLSVLGRGRLFRSERHPDRVQILGIDIPCHFLDGWKP